jgi:CheY-like chemotaxis protein
MKKRVPSDSPISRLIENATRGAERGRTLTQRLLAFARRQELKPEAVDVGQLIVGMDDLLKRALGPVVSVERQIPGGLAPARVDANQLELSLLNLALNARDAMPNGGTLTIAACNETVPTADARLGLAAGAYVRIAVRDTGQGMDEATLARATEPFFTTKGLGKGTGLGLSMVHGLAAQSGGKLTLSSRAGEGTEVELWLPQAEVIEAAARTAVPADAPRGPQERRTVLLVDDDPLVLSGTSAMLEDLGHAVIESESGVSALELLRQGHAIDLVITDHAMPGMTGIDLARRIRQTRPDLAIVLATGYAELPDEEQEAGDIAKLAKPYRLDDLAAAMDAAWRGRAAFRAAV